MSESLAFRPPRRRGMMFHLTVIVALGASSALSFLLGMNQQVGSRFAMLLLVSLLLFAPLPWVVYRAYALSRASYRLERNGVRLRWGLRAEDIPLPDIEWVRRSTDLAADLPLPPLHWPGALLGSVRVTDLGPVEYMASTVRTLVLIATPKRIYAISPEDPEGFLRSFRRTLELGSLTPISSASVLPAAYLTSVWADKAARWLLVSSFALTLLLFLGAGIAISGRTATSLGFYPSGEPLPPGPAAQLLLLPVLGAFIFLVDLATGLYFYRGEQNRVIAYILWSSAVVSPLLLIGAILFILLNS